jgi:hypothetical protein
VTPKTEDMLNTSVQGNSVCWINRLNKDELYHTELTKLADLGFLVFHLIALRKTGSVSTEAFKP